MTVADIEAFLDGFMPMQLERENVAGAVISVVKDLVLTGGLPSPPNLAFHAVFAALLLAGALTPNERYHKLNVIVGLALFVFYTLLLFTRIGRGH